VGVFLRAGLFCVWFGRFVFIGYLWSIIMMQWTEVKNSKAKAPKWALKAGLYIDGRVFVSAALAGLEFVILWDVMQQEGAEYYPDENNHIYLPTDYMKKQYPKTREACDVIERQVREIISKSKERV
jgi:hypothetical protein